VLTALLLTAALADLPVQFLSSGYVTCYFQCFHNFFKKKHSIVHSQNSQESQIKPLTT